MFKDNRITFLLILSILSVIFFDALQQKFYLDTFNIQPGSDVTFLFLLQVHFIRWSAWLAATITGIILLRSKNQLFSQNKPVNWVLVSIVFFCLNLVAILVISLFNIIQYGSEFTFALLQEIFTFMIYQKGMSFTFASGLTLLLMYNQSKKQVIDAQWVEIQSLKDLVVDTSSEKESNAHHLLIRIGSREKLIPISEITWFEADDYCVRIHTETKTYSLRKSLKSLEKDLQDFNFIRVHRRALVNLSYFEQADFNNCTVTLSDHSEIPISKSRISHLKQVLKAASL